MLTCCASTSGVAGEKHAVEDAFFIGQSLGHTPQKKPKHILARAG